MFSRCLSQSLEFWWIRFSPSHYNFLEKHLYPLANFLLQVEKEKTNHSIYLWNWAPLSCVISHSLLFIMVREELFCGNTFNNSVTFWSFMSLALFLGAWINQICLSLFNPSTSPTASVECLVQTGKYATVIWWNLEAFRFRKDLIPLVLPAQSQKPAWYHVPAHWKRVVLWWVCFLLQEEQGSLSTRCFNCRSETTHHSDSPHFLILISGLPRWGLLLVQSETQYPLLI